MAMFCCTAYYSGCLSCTIVLFSQLHIKLCQFKRLGRKIPFLLSARAFLGKITKMFQLSPRYFEGKINALSKLMDVNTLLDVKFMGNKNIKWIFLFLFVNLKSQTCPSDELLKSCSLPILSWEFQQGKFLMVHLQSACHSPGFNRDCTANTLWAFVIHASSWQ